MKFLSIFLSSILLLFLCACGGNNSGEVYKTAGLAEADTLLEASYDAFDSNDFAKAQEYGEKALAIYIEAEDTINQRDCYTHLCACYMRTSDAERAITMGFKALHIDSLRHDYEAMGSAYNNIAAVYLSIKDNENARKFIDRSLEMDRIVGNAKSASVHLGIACEVYNKLGNYDEALMFATLAYEKDK
ncbi:MAG: tetratricopeptide repeat protein [Prevotella sp.]|nr:tetratricopeptide repeat protein [Prevotella sp.]